MSALEEDLPREAIRKEASRLHESTIHSSQGQLEAAKLWGRLHWILGGAATVVGATSGVLTFAGGVEIVSGVLAIAASLTAAALMFTRPDRRAEEAALNGNRYIRLRDEVRRLLHIDVPHEPVPGVRRNLEELAAKISELNESSDPIPRSAYRRAKRNIEQDKGQDYRVDE